MEASQELAARASAKGMAEAVVTGRDRPALKGTRGGKTVAPPDDGVSLSIERDYLARLIIKVRALEAREGVVDPESGSNAVDDGMRDVLQDEPGDLSRSEVLREIAGLNERQQAELVALLWTGRGDAEPEEWERTIEIARSRKEVPTPRYLLDDPLLPEYWLEGASRLGVELSLG